MPDTIKVEMPALPQNMLAIRMLTAGLGNLYHFDSEEIEDIKLAVSEACFFVPGNKQTIEFILESEKIMIEVRTITSSSKNVLDLSDAAEERMGLMLMRKLMNSFELKIGAEETVIKLVKNQKVALEAVK